MYGYAYRLVCPCLRQHWRHLIPTSHTVGCILYDFWYQETVRVRQRLVSAKPDRGMQKTGVKSPSADRICAAKPRHMTCTRRYKDAELAHDVHNLGEIWLEPTRRLGASTWMGRVRRGTDSVTRSHLPEPGLAASRCCRCFATTISSI